MAERAWLLGVGLDGSDGHTRITRAEDVLLVGGSQETHERMQDHVIHIGEELSRRGKALADCSPQEVADIVREVVDR
ncbi:MAG: hypothetical protein AB7O52_02100 [Planctomycetota bacterium]